MSFMFEVYYKGPADTKREESLCERVAALGGRFDYREEPNGNGRGSICLTFEFDDAPKAHDAADALRRLGEHVEGPVTYGPVQGDR